MKISAEDFKLRTDSLAESLLCSHRELVKKAGISMAMYFAYRSGKYRVSGKAWAKINALCNPTPKPVVMTMKYNDMEFIANALEQASHTIRELNDAKKTLAHANRDTQGNLLFAVYTLRRIAATSGEERAVTLAEAQAMASEALVELCGGAKS